jgi:hypothetical protein
MNRLHRSFPLKAAAVAVAILTAASIGASGRRESQASPDPRMMGPGTTNQGRMGPGATGGDMMGRGDMRGGRGGTADRGSAMGGMRQGGQGQQTPQAPLLDKPLTLDGAAERVQAAIKEWGYQDLVVDEVIQYSWNYYVLVKEKSTGKGAVELLVDPRTGVVSFEPGPNMMWNTKYGHMRSSGAPAAASITADEAKQAAAQWLTQSGDTTAWTMDVNEMYGYYTIHLVRDGRMEAMLSVNASTRAVWYHTWHGPFVAAKEMQE